MSELVKCATCKTEKPASEMQTCMQADREYSVCDMTCMIKFYKGEIKPDIVITPDLEEMGKLGMNPKEYDLYKANLELAKQLAKANERVDGLEKALANCADALYESNINHKKAIDKIQAECIDVLFDFAAKRDDSGFAIALYEQPYEIQDAIRTFKQLSKDQ